MVCYDTIIVDTLLNSKNWVKETKPEAENLSSVINNSSRSIQDVYRLIKLLSKKEKEILALIGECKSNIDIAKSLHSSKRTVETHKTHMITKLCFKNARELFAFAVENKSLLKKSNVN